MPSSSPPLSFRLAGDCAIKVSFCSPFCLFGEDASFVRRRTKNGNASWQQRDWERRRSGEEFQFSQQKTMPPPPFALLAVNFREREMLLKGKKETRRRKKRVQTRIKEEKVSQTSFSNRPIHCLRGLGRKKRGGNCFFEKEEERGKLDGAANFPRLFSHFLLA